MNQERNQERPNTNRPIKLPMQIAKQLKFLLNKNDITVAQLARKVGVSSKTIYNWLGGQPPKDIRAVKKVADHLNVTLDFLCYGINSSPKSHSFEEHQDEINAGIYEVVLRRVKK